MDFLDCLFYLFVQPLKLLLEAVFMFANKITDNAGLSIIILSLAFNFLVLPLYKRADELQAEERDIQAKMAYRIKRTKQTFKGDERFLMLQEYYRINNYKPIYALKSSASLLLQIPFFIAAYNLLSGMKILHGASFLFIADLGKEDASFMIGSFPVNILPILMTVINIVSGILYTKGHPLKAKIQVYGLAVIFLVFLYHSPAGLVFYWTLNNVFSLVKNLIVSLRGPKPGVKQTKKAEPVKGSLGVIILSLAVLTALTGLLIPGDIISKNPIELFNTFIEDPHSPLLYIIPSLLTATGFFLIWIPVFYYFTKTKTEKIIMCAAPVCAIAGTVNYVLFNKNFGLLQKTVVYEKPMNYAISEIAINLAADLVIAAIVIFFVLKFKSVMKFLLAASVITIAAISLFNFSLIYNQISNHIWYNETSREDCIVPLTTTGQNVVVIMMDRMIGAYVPYLFNERPDVAQQFDGFTYYPNTMSYGLHTNHGAPALYGGYEYTPLNMNARSDVLLVDKHNESILLMPRIFSESGWNVTVSDPPFANYEWVSDVSIYDGLENTRAFNMAGAFNSDSELLIDFGDRLELRHCRNYFCYGLVKTLPYLIQPPFYDNGNFNSTELNYYSDPTLTVDSIHTQVDGFGEFAVEYAALEALDDVVQITDDPQNCFFMYKNGTAHSVCLLSEPEYKPALYVDNTGYDLAHMDRFTVDGRTMRMDTDPLDYSHYECAMAAVISLGNWFDYLRENGLYDNTRIIIVSDHGYNLGQFDELNVTDIGFDAENANCVLMVKDFNSEGFTTVDDFMTNADTPYLAFEGVIEDPVNPFTGNPITPYDKSGDQIIYSAEDWSPVNNKHYLFDDEWSTWYMVNGNIWDKRNWSVYEPD